MDRYTTFLASGRAEDAYFELGMALHPIMDSTSPSHRGFQTCPGANPLLGLGYVAVDGLLHYLAEREISDSQLQETVALINEALNS